MRLIRALSRFVFGLTFIFSGFTKLIDPVGTSLIFKEYFSAFHMTFMSPYAIYAGMFLSVIEFLIGICILLGLRMRIASATGLVFISFFTILTFYLAIFNPISDCGCFGNAVHLTNKQTFVKNLILLFCALIIFFQRKKYLPIAPSPLEWVFMALYAIMALIISLYAYFYIPFIDFTPLKVGTDLTALNDAETPDYETVFVYEKGGIKKTFSINNLPDSTWNFIDSETSMINKGSLPTVNFSVTDNEGEDYTDHFMAEEKLIAASLYDPDKIKPDQWEQLANLQQAVIDNDGVFVIIASKLPEKIPGSYQFDIYLSDIKNVLTLNRSNGGATYFNNGLIIQKWAYNALPVKSIGKIFSHDSETLVVKNDINEKLYASATLAAIIMLIVLMRYICRISYKRRYTIEKS